MPAELLMPRVSPAMQEATVVGWLKKEGDPIRKDEIVVTIESEKASQDVEALTDGVLYKIVAQVGDVVPVNTPLAIIRLPQDTVADLRLYDSSTPPLGIRSDETQSVAETAPTKANGVIKSSPLARKLAESHGIDLAAIPGGSGPGGRIVEQDVLAFCEALASKSNLDKTAFSKPETDPAAIASPDDKHLSVSSVRQRTIARLRESKDNTIPVTSVTEMDLTDLVALYRQVKPIWQAAHQTGVTLNAFFVKAVALALRGMNF